MAPAQFNAKEHIKHYEERFVAHLDACALSRSAGDPEPFLLNARKALEAGVYIAHIRVFNKTPDASLEDLVKGLVGHRSLDKKIEPFFLLIRTLTNPAAHVIPPNKSVSAEDVFEVAGALPKVARWFLKNVSDPVLKNRVEAALAAIGDRSLTPPDAPAVLELVVVQNKLAEQSETLGHFRAWIVVAAVVGALGGVTIASAVTSARSSRPVELASASAGHATSSQLVDTGHDGSVDREDGGSPTASASPIPLEPAAPPTCPRGMGLVAAGPVEIGQPIGGRRDWPLPTPRRIAPIEVATFCIHRLEVPQQELDSWRLANEKTVPSGCAAPRDPNFPAVCVADDEAARYCADRGWSLPSIAEWERVARIGGVRSAPGTSEWVEDAFPPAVFHRAGCGRFPDRCGHRMVRAGRIDDDKLPAEPRVLFSWNAPNPQVMIRRDVGFRCVSRLSSAPSE